MCLESVRNLGVVARFFVKVGVGLKLGLGSGSKKLSQRLI